MEHLFLLTWICLRFLSSVVPHDHDDGHQIIIRQNSGWTINVSSCLKKRETKFSRKNKLEKNCFGDSTTGRSVNGLELWSEC